LTSQQVKALRSAISTTNTISLQADRMPTVKVTVRTKAPKGEQAGFVVFAAIGGEYELAKDAHPEATPAQLTTFIDAADITQFDKLSSPTNAQVLSVGEYYLWAKNSSGPTPPQQVALGSDDQAERSIDIVVPDAPPSGPQK
jgi:hypothetical protein